MPNPSQLFLAERAANAPGSAVLCCIEGSRPLLVEIQALVSSSTYGNARRMASGIDQNRLSLLLAVLEKRAGLNLIAEDVYVNVAGGMAVDEPAADLGVVAAVASSLRNRAIKPGTVVFGEVGLAGEIRATSQAALRVREAAHMGFTRCVLPDGNCPQARRVTCPPTSSWSERRPSARHSTWRSTGNRNGPAGSNYPHPTGSIIESGFIPGVRYMPWHLIVRALFVIAVTYAAVLSRPFSPNVTVNLAVGVALGLLMVLVETRLREAEVTDLLGALIGAAIGLGLAKTIGAALFWADTTDRRVVFLHSFILLVFPYLGIIMGGRKGEWLKPARLVSLFRDTGPQKRYRILDTSVIIDGRVADICETGFLDGTLVIPQFVLKELQLVADSPDSLKRNRGRRGLDILQKIQKMAGVDVMISDIDFPEAREVDLKLIELARTLQGKIVTNDFNLNKVAQLRGVQVLNINELANSLKPVVLPGEFMKVFILKEGKEYNQGVAYLDDGTMVVVDNARRMISRNIDVVVTSVLQTTAGKMIFGRYIESGSPTSSGVTQAAAVPAAGTSGARVQGNAK